MTLQEAIKLNNALRKDLVQKGIPTYAAAIQLSNEALKAWQELRLIMSRQKIWMLPGETKD